MKISIKVLLFVLVVNFNCHAQSPRVFYNIPNGWTDVNIFGQIGGKFSWQIENHHRRQDAQGDYNIAEKTGNIYKNLNQHIFRPYIHYQLNPNIRFSLMPLGWMGSNRFSNGKVSSFFSELRIAPQAILTQNLGKLRIDSRLRYEFRIIGKNEPTDNHSGFYGGDFSDLIKRQRFRYQLKGTLPLNHKKMDDNTLYLQAFNELFVNIGEKVPTINLFDQNRVLVGIGYKFNKFYSFEAGFMRQSFYRFNNKDTNGLALNNNVDRNNILQLNFVLNNFEGLFKKKEEIKK